MAMATQQADLTYAVVGGEMKIDPNIAANPAYEAVKCDQEDHTYDIVSEGVDSKQRRGNWLLQRYFDGCIASYFTYYNVLDPTCVCLARNYEP